MANVNIIGSGALGLFLYSVLSPHHSVGISPLRGTSMESPAKLYKYIDDICVSQIPIDYKAYPNSDYTLVCTTFSQSTSERCQGLIKKLNATSTISLSNIAPLALSKPPSGQLRGFVSHISCQIFLTDLKEAHLTCVIPQGCRPTITISSDYSPATHGHVSNLASPELFIAHPLDGFSQHSAKVARTIVYIYYATYRTFGTTTSALPKLCQELVDLFELPCSFTEHTLELLSLLPPSFIPSICKAVPHQQQELNELKLLLRDRVSPSTYPLLTKIAND